MPAARAGDMPASESLAGGDVLIHDVGSGGSAPPCTRWHQYPAGSFRKKKVHAHGLDRGLKISLAKPHVDGVCSDDAPSEQRGQHVI